MRSARAVLDSMRASVPTQAAIVSTKPGAAAQLQQQITNGNFSNGRTGWSGLIVGNSQVLPAIPNEQGPRVVNFVGAPAPAARLIGVGNLATHSGFPSCATFGYMYQDVTVLPGTWLTFNWGGDSATDNTFLGIEGTLGVSIRDPISDRELWRIERPNSTVQNGFKRSELNLFQFVGQDVRIRFEIRSKGVAGFFVSCNDNTWVDNVALEQRGVTYSNTLPTSGAWYNPLRAGSGWDFRRAPDGSYYGSWYTYSGGQPTWYFLDQGYVVNGTFSTIIRKFERVGTSSQQTVVGRAEMRLLDSNSGLMSFDFFDTPNAAGIWDRTEYYQLLTPTGGAFSGHWNDGVPTDPNWGFGTLPFSGNQLFALHYFYNGSQPTWAFSQGGFGDTGTLGVVKQIGGLCPSCPGYTPSPIYENIGSIYLAFPASANGTVNSAFSTTPWTRPLHTFHLLAN
ncbi:MAG: hypothetical protein JNN30_13625 [Rhodanobacteraceae bacterium]|nr:hypothetical protein [Rhodanobacteraceae bacterium]